MSEEIIDPPVKRGRGRPKGSLNKKTLAKQEAMRQAHRLDVSFEDEPEPEPMPAPVPEPDPKPIPDHPEPEVSPHKKQKARTGCGARRQR